MASIIRTDSIQNLNTSNIITQTNATTLTLGYSGQTIAVASGATLLGGGITWTSTVVTSALTVAVNTGYFVNTSSNAITVTLPASASVGNTIILSDFNRTWSTNALTLNQNSLNFQGFTSPNPVYNTAGQSVQLVYSGATKGWIPISDDDVTDEVPQTYAADFLVIAGGASGARNGGGSGGGGAGGYRNSYSTEQSGGGGSTEADINLTPGQVYTITIGAGGAGQTSTPTDGNNGSNSSIIGTGVSITSTGGGAGGQANGVSGGCGGGAGENGTTGGSGTTNQGFGAGDYSGSGLSSGGGGVGVASANGSVNGNGGNGLSSSITGSAVTRGGGGGCSRNSPGGNSGGSGGGGNGGAGSGGTGTVSAGTANTGGGGGGQWSTTGGSSGAGGSGVIILRMLTSKYSGITTGSPTVSTSGSDTILVYNASGSYTA
jgi:hypothetical protein